MPSYYEMNDHLGAPGRWWLDQAQTPVGKKINGWTFIEAKKLKAMPLITIPLFENHIYKGKPIDFTFGDCNTPVVNRRTLALLEKLVPGAFQAFPASIEGQKSSYWVINFLHLRKCLDESRSDFTKFTKGKNSVRPDLAGEYSCVYDLKINPKLIGDAEIVRLWGWEMTPIVSDRIRRAFIEHKISGVHFTKL
ncbi:MAG TPA: DUF1629 domain-containing protein [Verrucomicrobiae bacterium]